MNVDNQIEIIGAQLAALYRQGRIDEKEHLNRLLRRLGVLAATVGFGISVPAEPRWEDAGVVSPARRGYAVAITPEIVAALQLWIFGEANK